MGQLKRTGRRIVLFLVLATTVTLLGCEQTSFSTTGVNQPMKTHYIGRFSVDIPEDLEVSSGGTLRDLTITETPWPEGMDRAQAREMEWNRFLENLALMTLPDGKDSAILKIRDFPELGEGARGIFHYDKDYDDAGIWQVMMDSGRYAVWFESHYTMIDYEQETNAMANNIVDVGQAYREIVNDRARAHLRDGWFHLEHNAIQLPFFEQESCGIGANNTDRSVELFIEMESDIERGNSTESPVPTRKTVREFKKLASDMDVHISAVRYGERKVAGMTGGELIYRAREDGEESIHFTWEYNGVYDTGEYPAIKIEMECSDGRWKENIALWDAVLDSVQPLFERK